jgi:hypothetical protein
MAQAAAIITLSEGLRKASRRARNPAIIADLRLATCYSRALAALKIEAEAQGKTDPGRQVQLKLESARLNGEPT